MDRLILECVNSILAQKFKDYEIIIKDGLSSDKTLEVIKQINNKKTKIISNSDSGIYDAMNQGIHVATGSWIYFMGADDQFYNDSVLTNVSKEIEKYSNVDFFYGDFFSGNQFYVNKFNWKIMKGNSLNHQSIFYNKNIFIDNYYDTSYKLAADYKFNLQLYIDKKKSIKIPFIISKYGFEGLSSKNKNIGLIECERSRIEVCGSAMGMVLNFFVRIYDCLKRLIS
jgi:glycosyltransferase involved in cell wall biosynthesis